MNTPSPPRPPEINEQVTDASFSFRGNGDVLATAAEDGTVRIWDTRVSLLEGEVFPRSISCLRAFRAAPEGSTLSRVLVLDAETALMTGDQENRLLKVSKIRTKPARGGRGGEFVDRVHERRYSPCACGWKAYLLKGAFDNRQGADCVYDR